MTATSASTSAPTAGARQQGGYLLGRTTIPYRAGVEPANGGKLDLIFDDLPPGSYTLAVRIFTAAGDGQPAFDSFTVVGSPSPEAEANCRTDHRADVQATFAWALEGTPYTPPPVETPAPAPQGQPPTAPRRIDVWTNRRDVVDIDILPPWDGGGLPMRGFRWTLEGPTPDSGVKPSEGAGVRVSFVSLPEGDYTFTARAFNDRGDGPSASVSFTVKPSRDPLFQQAIDLLWERVVPVQPNLAHHLNNTQDVLIVFDQPARSDQGGMASYNTGTKTITISPDYRNRPLESLAISLAHEIIHASDDIDGRLHLETAEQCFEAEVRASGWEAAVTVALGWRSDEVDHWRNGTLDSWVRSRPLYQEQCAA